MHSKKNLYNVIKMIVKYPRRTFQFIRTIIDLLYRNQLFEKNIFDHIAKPRTLSFKLTNKCDLRCSMCMQWGKKGLHLTYDHYEQNLEISWSLLKKTLLNLKRIKPTVILWGGEPLLYLKFRELMGLLDELKYNIDICTNGTQIIKYIDIFRKIKNKLGILVSLDGLEQIHDSIRGKGSFNKTMQGIEAIIDINKNRSIFKRIQLGIEITLVEKNIGHIIEFAEYLNDMDLSWVVFNMQWVIDKKTGIDYENYLKDNWFNKFKIIQPDNWSSAGYYCLIDEDHIKNLRKQIEIIQRRKWRFPIIFQPPILPNEVDNFFHNISKTVALRKYCRVHWSRIDFYPDGSAVACKQFPDIKLGNLNDSSIEEIWDGEKFCNFRRLIKKSLLPVCSKCPSLYTYGK